MFTKKSVWLLVLSLFLMLSCSDDSFETFKRSSSHTARTKHVARGVAEEPTGQEEAGPTDNRPPAIEEAKLVLGSDGGRDYLKIESTVADPDNDDVVMEYRWFKNGEQTEYTGKTMNDFKRGDKIMAEVTPYDGFAYGSVRNTIEMEINNTSPRIIEHSDAKFDGKIYQYGIKAIDTDGDTLTYELKKGPKGMMIDAKTGLVSWEVPDDFAGSVEASVVVSDGHKGSVQYDFTASISGAPPKQ